MEKYKRNSVFSDLKKFDIFAKDSDLEAANLAYRNLCTEKNAGRYEGILLIEIVKVNNG